MNQFSNNEQIEDDFNFRKEVFKYLYFWKFFLSSFLICLVIAFSYLRYTQKVYNAKAKIKIIDKKESSLELPTASELFSKSKINLENEIEVIKSFPILSQVIKSKNLQMSIISVGDIMESMVVEYPFEIKLNVPIDSLSGNSYRINVNDNGFEIIDNQYDTKKYNFQDTSTKRYKHELPFEIFNLNREKCIRQDITSFKIEFSELDEVVTLLKKKIKASQVGKNSEIIELSFESTNAAYCEIILNELIKVFNNDGVKDRQLIHKRTIDFVNQRYAFLSLELDSIEIIKQLYKADNDLVDLITNSTISLEKSYNSKESVFSIENQISVTSLLITTLQDSKLELLPANIGIENVKINLLISDYNQTILNRKKLISSAGNNNPTIKQIDNLIRDSRKNIIFSLKNHLNQLNNLKSKLSAQFSEYDNQVANLPENEKILRNIERNQEIKEALYLFLLQKREEAEVSYAVTEPSFKVVEYAIVSKSPVYPKASTVYFISIFCGILIPLSILYILFAFNNKIFSKEQFDDLNLPLPLISEIPEIVNQPNTTVMSPQERSNLAEAFRVLTSKLKYFSDFKNKDGQVIMVTSTIKGEGKTFCATNLAYTKSSLGQKVLLIGADLHNPQIHTYINIEKNQDGLVNYLVDNSFDWKKAVKSDDSSTKCDILICGQIPPNPAQLLNNGNFEKLLDEAKKIYDQIIIDTPPCLLVSDTLSINHLSDLLLFVVRCNHTTTDVLDFIRDSYNKELIKKNSVVVLNGLGANNRYGYGYAYNYSYGYRYNYSYNYGYGYEYKSD